MRTLMCRFMDEAELSAHLNNGGFVFLSDDQMALGKEVQIQVLVADCRQSAKFRMILLERQVMTMDNGEFGSRYVFSYKADVVADDKVWLDEFVARVETASRVRWAA